MAGGLSPRRGSVPQFVFAPMPLFSPIALKFFPRLHALAWSVAVVLASPAATTPRSPLTPEQSLAAFQVEPGMKVELVAAEPLVIAPVAIAFDEKGRMYVAEGRGYPDEIGGGKPALGRLALLEDTDGDGRFDRRSEFAADLPFPCGVLPWRGGVFVASAPDILYLKDTDGDGRADVRRVVLTGFDHEKRSTQHFVNSPGLGLDNWIYLSDGVGSASKVHSPEHPERPPVESSGHDWRFRPDTLEVEAVSGYGQYGLTFDDAGHRFVCYNRNPLRHVVLSEHYLKRNPHLAFSETMQEVAKFGADAKVLPISPDTTAAGFIATLVGKPHAGAMTSACGSHLFRGTALTPAHYGNLFVCEPAQNLVQRQLLSPAGGTFSSRPVHDGTEFLASPDSWFRPVAATTGPDGALYVCDIYRQMVDHPHIFPAESRAKLDFNAGKDRGRIYRVIADRSSPAARSKPVFRADVKALCAQLADDNAWTRETARRLLLERADPAAAPALRDLARSGVDARARLLALCTLDGLNALEDDVILRALDDPAAAVRENALRLAEPRLGRKAAFAGRVLARAGDADSHARFQCALTLGAIDDDRIVPALARIASLAPEDRWTRAAVFSSLGSRETQFLPAFLAVASTGSEAMPAMMSDLGRLLGASVPPDRCLELIVTLTASNAPADTGWQSAALLGIAEGLRNKGPTAGGRSTLQTLLAGSSPGAMLARSRFAAAVERAVTTAQDTQRPVSARLAAIGLLGQSSGDSVGATLLSLIAPAQPTEIQIAAIRAIGLLGASSTGRELLSRARWHAYLPPAREAVLATVSSQPALLSSLFDALEAGEIAPTSIDMLRRNQLMRHRNPAIRDRALKAFASLVSGDRLKVFEEYKSILPLKPDAANGRLVFARACAACHTYAGVGAQVGPDLTGIRNQPPEALLLHILVPSYEIVAGFQAYTIETKDGRTMTGFIASETETTVTLRVALGGQENILRRNIASMGTQNLSLMPEGLEKTMTRQELRDLLGFLNGADDGK